MPPRGVFSEDATVGSAHAYFTTQVCPCFKIICMEHSLTPFLDHQMLHFSVGTGVFAGLCPYDSHSLEAGVPGEKVFPFPHFVVQSSSLHFAIAFSGKQYDLQTTSFASRQVLGVLSLSQ